MFGLTPYRRNNRENAMVYDPMRMFEEFERSFFNKDFFGNTTMKVDIKDKGKEYIVLADLPGVDKSDIKIDIENGYLTVSAERKTEINEKNDENAIVRCERSYGSISRSFDISDVKEEDIRAEYKDGVLKLTMPKKEESERKNRRIEIE